jgi:hypothetical protein
MVISTVLTLSSTVLPLAWVFTRPAPTLSGRLLVTMIRPDPAWTRIDVQTVIELPSGGELAWSLQVVRIPSNVGNRTWLIACPVCARLKRKIYLCGRTLACQTCAGLRYVTRTVRSPRRRADYFAAQRRELERHSGRRSRRWGWLVVQERQEALRLLNQALRTASN